jgi:16S rRNA (adenine1518-N6/adenine1519-N6)-dimethyltransferase
MSLEETKQLLRTYRITPNKLLGQNFMVEPSLYNKLCTYASLNKSDVVLDVGAGFGFLSRYLANMCKTVIAVERDIRIVEVLHDQVKDISNLIVVEGDALKTTLPEFNKVIAIPPYYMSSHLITWLLERRIECAIMIIQKEFANRLVATVGTEDYGWITVLTKQHAEIELLDEVPKEMFYPQPEVDSRIIRLWFWSKKSFEVKDPLFFKQLVKWLFTQRNKKLSKSLLPFLKSNMRLSKQDAEKIALDYPLRDKRARELRPEDFGDLANAISK